ncbi:AraC family transcriptional regulator [Rhizobium sp. S-51]|uniref:AraC family transcriptional regulator n=1 Tax=Rhizobium terricola TaxID=2728849 RepID=A0A7Y0AWH2_9HYPH|nr:AraC family transcriptional regulator [Rhizobium terricola]NML74754.1 AraC family transcriptional regulator [Rhizobium terricola]
MDPLSDVLSLLKPENHMSAGFDVAGPWSIAFPDQQKSIKCGAVVTGTCWLAVEGLAGAVRLEPGDGFLLPSGRPFRMASDLALEPTEAGAIFAPVRTGGIVTRNGGGGDFVVSSRFGLGGEHADVLLRMLPPIVRIPAEADRGALRWAVERMMQELKENRAGSHLMVQHLAHMMLVEALRLHLEDRTGSERGWLFALADRQIGTAMRAIHDGPAYRWTLKELAGLSGMSRTSFAERFREIVGETPIDYLIQWRMRLAADRLLRSGQQVSVVALALGYESESAFSTTFKRVMGSSPRHYVRERQDRQPEEATGA